MSVDIMIQFEGKQLTLPINPESLHFDQSADNEDIEIIGMGKATRKGDPSLMKLSIESFFPSPDSYFYTGVKPKSCIDFIKHIWKSDNKNNNVARIVTSGLPINLNMFFVIESFTPEIRAGEEEDIYYTLEIKEYKPYGVKTVTVQKSGLAASRAQSTAKANASTTSTGNTASGTTASPQQQTYTVQKNDCLWNITKACCGNGARWKELYDLNKKVIGANPNLIKPGQVLTLPNGWTTPKNVTKLTNVNPKKTTNKSTAVKGAQTVSNQQVAQAAPKAAATVEKIDVMNLTPAQKAKLEQIQKDKYKLQPLPPKPPRKIY